MSINRRDIFLHSLSHKHPMECQMRAVGIQHLTLQSHESVMFLSGSSWKFKFLLVVTAGNMIKSKLMSMNNKLLNQHEFFEAFGLAQL